MNDSDFLKAKNNGADIKVRKGLSVKKNNNSADFISPNFATGCTAGCSYCVSEGTLISTPNGEIPVEQIQDGDVVLAYDSSTEQLVEAYVQGTASRVVKELIEIEVNGATIKTSLEHPFLTQRGWIEAQHLKLEDQIVYYH